MDEFTKIVPSSFGPFLGHHQELFACVMSVFKEFFFRFFINSLKRTLGRKKKKERKIK